MPKRSSNKPCVVNALAAPIVAEASGKARPEVSNKNPAAVELGRLGGAKGGRARANKLTPDERSRIARLAAQARWRKE